VNGHASIDLARKWLNGSKRAPAWFVAVLTAEIEARRNHLDRVLEGLAAYETGDRRKSPEARARGRLTRMRQLGRIRASGIDAAVDPSPSTPKPE